MVKTYKKNKRGGWLWSKKKKSKSIKAGRAKKSSNKKRKNTLKQKKTL